MAVIRTTRGATSPYAIALCLSAMACGEAPCEETLTCVLNGGRPTVNSVSPPNGAAGVADDSTVLVTFSAPMDRAATQNAFRSSTLNAPAFHWIDERTLEIVPDSLAYATGAPDVVANEYDYTFTDEALDLNGSPLIDVPTFRFTTYRRVEDIEPLTVSETSVQADGMSTECFVGLSLMWRVGQLMGQDCRNLMTVDLTPIPSEAVIERATLKCAYLDIVGLTPNHSSLERVDFEPSDLVAGWGAEALDTYDDAIPFSENPDGLVDVDISSSLTAAIEGDSPTVLQLRLRLGSPEGDSNLTWRNIHGGGCDAGVQYTYLTP